MTDGENEINDLFGGIEKNSPVSTNGKWIEVATEQKNPRLTLDLACSVLLVYNRLDKELINLTNMN